MKTEPESDDEFSRIKVGKPAQRKPKKTPRKVEQEAGTTPKGGH